MNTSRPVAALRLDLKLLWRHRIVALIAVLGAVWTALLLSLPSAAARTTAPWLLTTEIAMVGTTVVGAVILLERGQGTLAARRVSPLRSGEYLTIKVGSLLMPILVTAVPIALAGRVEIASLPMILVAVALTAVVTMLTAVAVAVRSSSVLAFMVALPLVLLPFLIPIVLWAAGLEHPALRLIPTVGAVELVQTGFGDMAAPPVPPVVSLAWLSVWCVVAAVAAHRRLRRLGTAPPPARRTARTTRVHTGQISRVRDPVPRGPVHAVLRIDLAGIRRDRLLLLIGFSPLLLASAIRFGYPPLYDRLVEAYGFDLDPYRGLLLAGVLLLVPHTFGMIGALLVFDDVDDRALVALRTSPLSLPRYLGHRVGLVTAATLAGLLVAVPLSGLASQVPPGRLVSAMLLATAVAVLIMLAGVATARDKLEGVAALKLLSLPLFAPLAGWWPLGPWTWALAVLPPWWLLQNLWTSWIYALGGVVVTAVAAAFLARRALARLAAA